MKITNIRQMTDDEMERQGWHTGGINPNPPVLELENGDVLFPSRDPEGNGPGALFGEKPDGEGFMILPEE